MGETASWEHPKVYYRHMCYAYKPVYDGDGNISKVHLRDFLRMVRTGAIVTKPDGYHYAKDTVGVLIRREGELVSVPMRWDLVPRDFLHNEKLSLAETIKRKNSRAKNPHTGKPWGFSSFNARVETVGELWSFRRPWNHGLRCVMPVSAFKERPNMKDAPKEFQGKEYEISLDGAYYLGGIYDTWESSAGPGSAAGEKLDSCTVITFSSEGNALLKSIWHERIPLILTESRAEAWLDPKLSPAQALQLCLPFDETRMESHLQAARDSKS